jgi:xanthine dehydrogenase small subunit
LQFDYVRPSEWPEALALLSQPGVVAKMGGCDVATRYRRGRLQARLVVGLNRLPAVNDLSFSAAGARIGPAVTLRRLEREPELVRRWTTLAAVIASIASPALRSSATLIGNVAQGWSVSDLVPLLQVCDAELGVLAASGERRISVMDYAKSPRNGALKSGEVITSLTLPAYPSHLSIVYERFTFRAAFDLPLVSVALRAAILGGTYHDVRVAVVGGASMPSRCPPVEAALEGKLCNDDVVEIASDALAKWAQPREDHFASADYRRHVLCVTLRKAMAKIKESEEQM